VRSSSWLRASVETVRKTTTSRSRIPTIQIGQPLEPMRGAGGSRRRGRKSVWTAIESSGQLHILVYVRDAVLIALYPVLSSSFRVYSDGFDFHTFYCLFLLLAY
jgi:hypothetical protein